MTLLRQVREAARLRSTANEDYRRAIKAAAVEHSQADIARAAGVTPQAVSQLLRWPRD